MLDLDTFLTILYVMADDFANRISRPLGANSISDSIASTDEQYFVLLT